MHPSQPIRRQIIYAASHNDRIQFKEFIPLKSTNYVMSKTEKVKDCPVTRYAHPLTILYKLFAYFQKLDFEAYRILSEACTKELQALFECLKKWEYDNLPCADLNKIYHNCLETSRMATSELNKDVQKGAISETTGQKKAMTREQVNNLLQRYPQPQLGKYPYKAMKRLPNQLYSEDIFNRKNKLGKKN